MKVHISIDLEGITGVFRDAQTDDLGSAEHRAACELMRGDLDAALAGCADAGSEEIVVCDAHYASTNLGVEGLPPEVTLISGATPHLSMMEGIDSSFDASLLVGYHAKAGTQAGVLCHTFTDIITRVEVVAAARERPGAASASAGTSAAMAATDAGSAAADGDIAPYVTGEFGLCAAVAGAFNVPVVFTSGDDKLADEARELLPGVETAVTKSGIARSGARLRAPEAARADIRAGVARALASVREGAASVPSPIDWNGRVLRVTFASPANADNAAGCPTVSRLDGVTIEIAARDYLTAWRTFVAAAALAHA